MLSATILLSNVRVNVHVLDYSSAEELLTYCSRDTRKIYLVNSGDPDQMPQNAASDQGLRCLQIV